MGRRFYLLWLLSAALGAVGAAADVSWHFSRVFDEFSPPHNVATTGFILNIGLLYWALVRNRDRITEGERVGLMLNVLGTGLFLLGIPLDFTWHQIAGVDITTWSPTHLLLFYSACIAEVGVLKAWLASRDGRSAGAWPITFFICFFFLSAVLFPLSQQEYGATALDALNRTGRAPWYVAPDLWALAGPKAVRLVKGDAPDWLYPIYQPAAAALVLAAVSILMRSHVYAPRQGRAWLAWLAVARRWYHYAPATGLVLALLAFRVAARAFFAIVGMPVAVIPWWLLPLALVLDAAFVFAPQLAARTAVLRTPLVTGGALARAKLQALTAAFGAALGALAYYLTMVVLGSYHVVLPPVPLATLPAAALIAACGGGAGTLVAHWILAATEAPVRGRPMLTRAVAAVLVGVGSKK